MTDAAGNGASGKDPTSRRKTHLAEGHRVASRVLCKTRYSFAKCSIDSAPTAELYGRFAVSPPLSSVPGVLDARPPEPPPSCRHGGSTEDTLAEMDPGVIYI